MYQQDDRDICRARGAETRTAPCDDAALPAGGVITTKQWQAIDKFAGENTIYGSIRLTNRLDLPVSRYSEKERETGP